MVDVESLFSSLALGTLWIVGLIGGVTFLLSYLANWFLRYLLGQLREHRQGLATLLETFDGPASWLIWGFGGLLCLEAVVVRHGLSQWAEGVAQLRQLFLVLTLTWVLLRWKLRFTKVLLDRLTQRGRIIADKALVGALNRVATIMVVTLAGLTVLDTLGVPLQAIIAFGGLGSLAVSWAAKDVIANFFGGLMIFLNRPFWEDNWIRSPNKGFEGVVEEIGWYMTRIRSFDRRPTYIPNAMMTDAIIENPGRMYNRRIRSTVGVRYEDVKRVAFICAQIEAMLQAHPGIDQRQHLMVHFLEYGPYSLNIEVYCFTKTTAWKSFREVQQDVLLKVADIIEKAGAQIAFPTSFVYLNQQLSPARSGTEREVGVG